MQNVNFSNAATVMQTDSTRQSLQMKNSNISSTDLFETRLKDAASFTKQSQSFDKASSNYEQSGTAVDANKPESTANAEYSTKAAKLNEESSLSEEKVNASELEEKVSKAAKKVMDAIESQFDVSEDDLISAMENLGLTAIDLFNPAQLANLVTEINGDADSMGLILSDDFSAILKVADIAAVQLLEETGVSFEYLQTADTSETPQINLVVDENSMNAVTDMNSEAVEGITQENTAADEAGQLLKAVSQEASDTDSISAEEQADTTVSVKEVSTNSSSDTFGDGTDDGNSSDNTLKADGDDVLATTAQGKTDEVFIQNPDTVDVGIEATFNPDAETVELPTGESISSREIVNQLVEQASIFSTSDEVTMEMTLNPEGLGKIFMEVSQKGGEVTAKLFTENEAVKEALENQISSLRAGLNENTVKVTSIEISVATHEFEKNLEEGQRQNDNQDKQQPEQKRPVRIDLNNLDDLMGVMSEEESLAYQIMKDNGNTLDFQA